ncbi:hypothetical protein [Rhizobacter sp. Root404]|uniref:capsid assembly protein n=1 Tax=Rhizobacter sp. Root404 TaxID=1736528 RepID=UPI000701A79B|nr:hypothetical protein [Rhizobacter sp. Root404]KQW36753.1 hypothetical protein ASC76_19140 [Rhizobacter sp. Root404]
MSGFAIEGGTAAETDTTSTATTPAAGAPAAAATGTQAPAVLSNAEIAKLDKNSDAYRDAILAKTAATRTRQGDNAGDAETNPDNADAPDAPALILGKFKTQADLEKAYQAAQAELTKSKQGAKKEAPAAGDAAADEGGETAAAGDAPDFEALGQEFSQNGMDLTEDSKAKLYKQFGQGVVDSHLAGLKAQVELAQYKLLETVGMSKPEVTSLLQWAGSNLPAGDRAVFNASQNGGPEAAAAGLKMLKTQYEAANGKTATRTFDGGGNGNGGPSGFTSKADMKAAINDPRYKTDRAYAASVAARIRVSKLLS